MLICVVLWGNNGLLNFKNIDIIWSELYRSRFWGDNEANVVFCLDVKSVKLRCPRENFEYVKLLNHTNPKHVAHGS